MTAEISNASVTPQVLVSHPTGNQNVRNALAALAEKGMLAEFWTTVAWKPESGWSRFLPDGLRHQLARRTYPEAGEVPIHCVFSRELVRLIARDRGWLEWLSRDERPYSVIGMYRHFDGCVARRVRSAAIGAVYAYEGGARESFREAKRRGIGRFYELPSSYWDWEIRLLAEEAERNPEYAGLLPKLKDSARHNAWKDEELGLADWVIVPSEHVRRTLEGVVPQERIRVVAYGAPPVLERGKAQTDSSRPLQVLFVGALSQRKGIGYLLEAVERLGKRVELTIVGGRIAANSKVDAACSRWRWFPSLTHAEVLERMLEADVLVLPSLAEGCALVVPEALACGLPVIVTPNTGALEFVRDGEEGFVVPIADAEAIADRLNRLDGDRERLWAMSVAAQRRAQALSWQQYREHLAKTVREGICH